MSSKESGRGSTVKDGWIRETDYYQYDALGRLQQVRRRNPQDTDTRFPDKDHALLSIDYDYDAVGNVRHTQVSANYSTSSNEQVHSDDYYLYDENNRMTVNKGQLVHGQIMMTGSQGSTTSYDAAGNVQEAKKYEHGVMQEYYYVYNKDNQLELIQKKQLNLQSRYYDQAGRVVEEHDFDERGYLAQKNILSFSGGLLAAQRTENSKGIDASHTAYSYDAVGNLTAVTIRAKGEGRNAGTTVTHKYSYALWDGYLQSLDETIQTSDTGGSSTGKVSAFMM